MKYILSSHKRVFFSSSHTPMSTEKQALEPTPQSLGAKRSSITQKITAFFQNIKNALRNTLELTEEDEHAQYGIGSAGPGVAQWINRQGEKAAQEAKQEAKNAKNKKSTVTA